MSKPRVIYWFRTDLRLHDSPALKAALDLDPECLWPIFTWDPHYVYRARGGLNRWQFLLDCQNDLSASLTALNPATKLFVLREAPQTLFPKLFAAWRPTHLVFEKDTDAYARGRDDVVAEAARAAGVTVLVRSGRTLWDSDLVVDRNAGKPTMTTAQLQAAGKKIGPVERPLPAPTRIPDPGPMPLDFAPDPPVAKPDVNAADRAQPDTGYHSIAGPLGDFAIETMEELGFPPASTPHRGGESRAVKQLDAVIADTRYTATFEKPRTSPAAFDPPSTTFLSAFLHFGALSPRLFYWRVRDVVDAYGKGASTPPESLTGQLYFRDMYFAAQAALGHAFAQTRANAHCRFVPWHLPSRRDPVTGLSTPDGAYHVDSSDAEVWFLRWRRGVTGFPWIDALMRQLRVEGWIHHLGRHAVACFLTRGGCYIDWERGADVFEELLIDHEPACNAGNWQWLACVAFYSQYHRCYSPVSFGQKWDKHGHLIRRYVPELANMDEKYIYEPWKAPLPDQKKAGVRIRGNGLDNPSDPPRDGELPTYPKPMFDFNERRNVCMAAMKQAYAVGLHGNDEKVSNGTWRELFPSSGKVEMMGEYDSDDGEHADEGDDEAIGDKRAAKEESDDLASKKQKTER